MQKISVIKLWVAIPYIVLAVFVLPILIIISSIFGEWSENWSHLYDYVLFDYIYNSSVLVIGVLFVAFIVGTSSAWLVTNYRFPGKDFLEWALILPLAVPSYILAYTFTGLFDTFGTANIMLRELLNFEEQFSLFPNVRNLSGAIIVFSFTLYPYVYLVTRSAFLNQSQSMLEAGRLLGLNSFQVFYKLGIPIIRILGQSQAIPNTPKFKAIRSIGDNVFRLSPIGCTKFFNTFSIDRIERVKSK